MSAPTAAADAEPSQFGQAVVDAVRRYRGMVIAVAIVAMVAAIGYALVQPKVYRAQASITMPQQVSLQGQQGNSGQYLDGQVLLLQSQGVAQRAATIANSTLHSHNLTVGDFYGSGSSLSISPPTTAAPGGFGATVVGVSFAASSAQVAEAGTNAVIKAYDAARSAAIKSQDDTAINGIDIAIGGTNYELASLNGSRAPAVANQQQQLVAQRATLINQRAQMIVNEQIDLAQQPSVAVEPATTANHKWALDGGIGLIIGVLLGVALAVARASRRPRSVAG
jgi:LPS O-antigen subunit length determinant protein (WzzB/FepE family)